MRIVFNPITMFLLLLSTLFLPIYVNAHEGNTRTIDIAKDCEFMYILKGNEIQKLTLPNFTVVKSVNLPQNSRGINIAIAGGCSDPSETILVFTITRGPNNKILLSYNENLELIGQLNVSDSRNSHEDDDNDEENDD